ncbi:MAG TPA: PAS domain-containing sensor histidine kinase [Vicinamibacterales bacterium]|nr:PAS domain-containing sensor histidine kinase [Vicinamibacterales bacterium]
MAADNLNLVADLGMRVRELTLLHDVTRILQRDDLAAISNWLDEIARAIRRSWPCPDEIDVRARLGTFEVAHAGGATHPVRHVAEFVVADGRTGRIELAYAHPDTATPQPSPRSALLEDLTEMFKTAVDRRLVMAALRQSEQRYRSVVEHQSDLVCRYAPDTTLTFVNDAYCRFFGKRHDELIGRRFTELIPEADRMNALEHVASLIKGESPSVHEHSVLLPDGTTGRQQWINHAIRASNGEVEELQGIGRDISDRWRAEETLREKEARLHEAYVRIRSLAHQLMLAQEAERTEIARDLHDDVSQQLAALGIGLSLIEGRATDSEFVREEATRLREVAIGLAEKVRHVSHELHPGILQHTGLKSALASHCDASASQHAFLLQFEARGSVNDVPDDVALCLYRVTQQALRNVAMHANASRVWVTLVRVGKGIELTIADNGRGFDASARRAGGLGLLSIEERVHLVNGEFSITSREGGGSRLHITVPITWTGLTTSRA